MTPWNPFRALREADRVFVYRCLVTTPARFFSNCPPTSRPILKAWGMLAISGARASRFSFADRFKQASGDLAPLILTNPALQ
jgi:hypothetical protein